MIFVIEFFLVQNQTQKLIEPINQINLEKPLDNVCYEELRPLLFRLDQQNRQIKKQMEDLKNAESARKEFTANVSHELKTPLMSISGYAELMMNGMVPPDKIQDFSGRIFHESERYPIWLQILFSFPDWMRRTEKLCLNRLISENLGRCD